jgi:hypothetical protein
MPVATNYPSWNQAGPYLYLAGGYTESYLQNINTTQRLDMSLGSWQVGPKFNSRAGGALAIGEEHLYTYGGDANGGDCCEPTDLIEELNHALWPGDEWESMSDTLPIPLVGNMGGFCTQAVLGGEIWSVGGFKVVSGNLVAVNTNQYYPAEPCMGNNFAFSVAPDSLAAAGNPGGTVNYSLVITNTGDIPDAYSILVNSTWVAAAPAVIGALDPGKSVALQVTVEVPAGASAGDADTATVMVSSQGDFSQQDSAAITTSALEVPGVTLEPDSQGMSALPGKVVTYTLHLTNTGNLTDTYGLSYSGNQWDVTLPVTQTRLAAGASIQVSAQVLVPADALAGDADTATLTTTSHRHPTVTTSAALTTTAQPAYNLELAVVGSTGMAGMPGQAVSYNLQLKNMGNITDTYDLDCLGDDWLMDMPITQVTLAVGESADLALTVHIPLLAHPGDWDAMTFTAVSQGNPGISGTADLTTSVSGDLFFIPLIFR